MAVVRHLRSCRAYLPAKTSPGARTPRELWNVRGRSRHRKPRDLIELRSRAGVPNALMRRLITHVSPNMGSHLAQACEVCVRFGGAMAKQLAKSSCHTKLRRTTAAICS